MTVKRPSLFGQIGVAGQDVVGHRHGSLKQSTAATVGMIRFFFVEHHGVIEIINDSSAVMPQLTGVEPVETFFMQENAIIIATRLKQSISMDLTGRKLFNVAINAILSKNLQINFNSLAKTGSVWIIGDDKEFQYVFLNAESCMLDNTLANS